MQQWTVEHRMFTYDAYVQNGESVTAVQRLFRVHFKLGRRDTVPSRNTILRWIHSLRTTGSIVKKKPPGPNKTYGRQKTSRGWDKRWFGAQGSLHEDTRVKWG